MLRAKRRVKITRALTRPLRATPGWWGRHRYALFITATPVLGVAAALVTFGLGAALLAAGVGCGFMAFMSAPGPGEP